MKNSLLKKIVFLSVFCLLFFGISAQAQIGLPGGSDTVNDAPDAPIDGFLGLSLIAGAAIGLRKHIKGLKK